MREAYRRRMPIEDHRSTAGTIRASDAIAIRVLGDVEVHGPAGTFAAGRSRPGALLALLVAHAREQVTVDRLDEELWPAHTVGDATKRVQVNVMRLRRALATVAPDVDPASIVRTRCGAYSLEVDPENIDAV